MKKTKSTLLALAMIALSFTATAGTKIIGEINGLKIVRIKTAGVFAPSTTTIVAFDPSKPGTIEAVLNQAGGPGFVPAVATAGGVVGGAALLRPARTRVENGSSASSEAAGGTGGTATGGTATGGNSSAGAGRQNGSIHHNH